MLYGIYESKCWMIKMQHVQQYYVAKIRMLRWIYNFFMKIKIYFHPKKINIAWACFKEIYGHFSKMI